ncbi:hypothetical protein GCM10011506_43090 [Marivirga lumbricoides]|uniref:Helix-turn-helix type 11 domain-containing protein n=1 Tax=Marivirga lumbricoides TaxID=1046115 RepID=A0ABQ1N3C0_9BACT|nr:hypothetical protein GCM10011506_43090 [Marivirga lumbricoides]
MSGLKHFERYLFINELITKERTGQPAILAKKLNISERQVYRIIEDLKLHYQDQYTIEFVPQKKSYVFINNSETDKKCQGELINLKMNDAQSSINKFQT